MSSGEPPPTAPAEVGSGPSLLARLIVSAILVGIPLTAVGVGLIVALGVTDESTRGGILATVWVWALATVAAIGAAIYVGLSILRPIRRLGRAAVQPTRTGELPTGRADEVGEVARLVARLRADLDAAHRELSRRAATDPETGVLTARMLRGRLEEEVARARRYERPFTLVLVEVSTGDGDPAHVAATVEAAVRPTDTVGRLGPELFALLLPETDAGGARTVGERVRSGLGPMLAGTGVAVHPESGSSGEQLLQAALDALERARDAGGRVTLYGES